MQIRTWSSQSQTECPNILGLLSAFNWTYYIHLQRYIHEMSSNGACPKCGVLIDIISIPHPTKPYGMLIFKFLQHDQFTNVLIYLYHGSQYIN